MKEGKRMLTFPGPGGYEMKWAPGATRIPLQDAMSKHSMIPCARFGHLETPPGGLPARKMTFHARESAERESGSSSSSVPKAAPADATEAEASHWQHAAPTPQVKDGAGGDE